MRRYERIELIYYLRLFDSADGRALGHLVNVSSQGLMIVGEHLLELHRSCRVTMDLPEQLGEGGELQFSAEVLWSRRAAGAPFCYSGLRFVHVADEDVLVLEKLTRRFDRGELGVDIDDEMNPPEVSEGGHEPA